MKNKMKLISRRETLSILGVCGVVAAHPMLAQASTEDMSALINEITKGKSAPEADIYFELPEIAENGNQVKVSFEIDSPMTEENHVKNVYILADGNPAPNVAKFSFTPALGSCSATTRMRLSKTQHVYLLAAYNNGKFAITKSKVKVTIGGCGG